MKRFCTLLMLLCLIVSATCLMGCSSNEKVNQDTSIERVRESKQPERIQMILASGEVYEFVGTRKGMFFKCEDGYEIEASTVNYSSFRIYKDGQLVLTTTDATLLLPDRMP